MPSDWGAAPGVVMTVMGRGAAAAALMAARSVVVGSTTAGVVQVSPDVSTDVTLHGRSPSRTCAAPGAVSKPAQRGAWDSVAAV